MESTENVTRLLDRCTSRLQGGDVPGAMDELFQSLQGCRAISAEMQWQSVMDTVRAHELFEILRDCPIVRMAVEKPRGYAGDAGLIDHLYGCGDAANAPHPSSIKGQIYAYLVNTPASRAVRFRRIVLARHIADALRGLREFAAVRDTKVASLAAGHLREVELLEGEDRVSAIKIAVLDHDPISINTISESYPWLNIEPVNRPVRDFLKGKIAFSELDLIYAAGLLDYLDEATSARLLEKMFSALAPGGVALVANFLPGIRDSGFMEAVMDWCLIYRDDNAMRRLADGLPVEQVDEVSIFHDPDRQIVFLSVKKRACGA